MTQNAGTAGDTGIHGGAASTGGHQIVRAALDAVERGESVVVATVVATERSVPRHAGARMLVRSDGSQLGTIGGGALEARVIDAAGEVLSDGPLRNGAPRLLTFDLVDPEAGDPGVCGGTMTIAIETYRPEPNLVVIGCGHIGKAVTQLADWLGYHVTAIDDRPLATPEHVPGADSVLGGPFAESLAAAPITSATHVVLVTRNMGVDVEALPLVLATPARSIGVLGSRRRWSLTRQRLCAAGVDPGALDRVRSPLGAEIGAETPEQIALSIMAEIVQLG